MSSSLTTTSPMTASITTLSVAMTTTVKMPADAAAAAEFLENASDEEKLKMATSLSSGEVSAEVRKPCSFIEQNLFWYFKND